METGAKVVEQSPFVKVFAQSGVAYAAGIMNFVVMSAALSSMNTNVYLCSRMLFSLSRGNYAPQFLGRLGKAHTPIGAILVSGAGILLAAAVSMFTPLAYNYLLGVALFGAMIVWIFILVSHLSFRRRHGTTELPVRMPGFRGCNCRSGPADRHPGHDGIGPGILGDLLDRRRALAGAAHCVLYLAPAPRCVGGRACARSGLSALMITMPTSHS